MNRPDAHDILSGTVVPALETPLLDALGGGAELHRAAPMAARRCRCTGSSCVGQENLAPGYVCGGDAPPLAAPVDERTRYAAMRERAEKAEAALVDASRIMLDTVAEVVSERDAATLAASRATVAAEEALRLLSRVRARLDGVWLPVGLVDEVDAALRAAGLPVPGDAEPIWTVGGVSYGTSGNCPFCTAVLVDGVRCPECGYDAESLGTVAELSAIPGQATAERREHPSEPPDVWNAGRVDGPPATDAESIANVRAALPKGESCTDEEALAYVGRAGESPEQRRAADQFDEERER